jgi:hypothetical protein
MSASRMNRTLKSGSRDSSAESTLSAMWRGSAGSAAKYTAPMPPVPSTRSMRSPPTTDPTVSMQITLRSTRFCKAPVR